MQNEFGDPSTTNQIHSLPDVDVVCTWVDGSSESFKRKLKEAIVSHIKVLGYNPDALSIGENQFRDYECLRYSLRSVERFVPWVRHIFVVTNGQMPTWLCPKHRRISIISHEEIFPDISVLPTFNSSAIDTALMRIPGLSRYFIYINDDMLFGRPSLPHEFFGENGLPKIRFADRLMNSDLGHNDRQARSIAYCYQLLDQKFGPEANRKNFPHVPVIFDKNVLEMMEADWPDQFKRTRSHKFRNETDIKLHVMFLHYLVELYKRDNQPPSMTGHQEVLAGHHGSAYIQFGDPHFDVDGAIARIWQDRPSYICVNDVMGEAGPISCREMGRQNAAVIEFLSAYYPDSAPWEIDAKNLDRKS